MNVLVTGGAGYIGSHTCVELLEAGHLPIVIDNLCNSSAKSLQRVREITGKAVPFCLTQTGTIPAGCPWQTYYRG